MDLLVGRVVETEDPIMTNQDIEQLKTHYLYARRRWSSAKILLLQAKAMLEVAHRNRERRPTRLLSRHCMQLHQSMMSPPTRGLWRS